eukprot:480898-Prorocentrum_lima.AAC.1
MFARDFATKHSKSMKARSSVRSTASTSGQCFKSVSLRITSSVAEKALPETTWWYKQRGDPMSP